MPRGGKGTERVRVEPLIRLMSHVEIQDDGCWLWTGTIDKHGYGHTIQGSRAAGTFKYVLAHRLSYELHRGPIPDGLQLDHLCRVRSCVNPKHLEPVTNRENLARSPMVPWNGKAATCQRGHPFDGANTIVYRNGRRQCRTCKRKNAHEAYLRSKR